MKKLNIYAPGDGALSFAWVDGNLCVGGDIRPEDIALALTRPENVYLVDKGYRVISMFDQYRLVANVKRVLPDVLEKEGTQFKYRLNPEYVHQDGTIGYHALVVSTMEHEVKHISTLSALCFFLNHEKELANGVYLPPPHPLRLLVARLQNRDLHLPAARRISELLAKDIEGQNDDFLLHTIMATITQTREALKNIEGEVRKAV